MEKNKEFKYKLSGKWRFFHLTYATMLCVFVILFFSIALSRDTTFFQKWIMAPIFIIISIVYARREISRALTETLVITPSGVEYATFDFNLFSKWGDIKRIAKERDYFIKVTGICVDKATSEIRKSNLGTTNSEFFIPISTFSKNWEDSEVGKQIRKYAPQLFDQ